MVFAKRVSKEYLKQLELSFKLKAGGNIYHHHIIDIGVLV